MKSLYKNIATMVAGTGLSQVIAIALSPVLLRIFDPEHLGLLTSYSAIVSIIAVVASGRYEMAVMAPKEDAKAWDLIKAALTITFCSSLLVAVVIVALHFLGVKLNVVEKLGDMKFALPLGVLLTSSLHVLTMWGTRVKKYRNIAGSKILQTSANTGVSIGTGLWGYLNSGLIIGQLTGIASASLMLLRNRFKGESSGATIRETLKTYREYPAKTGTSGILTLLGHQVPVLLIGEFFLEAVVGLYGSVMKVMNLPLNMLGKSISQVYFQEVSERIRQGQEIRNYVLKFTGQLFLLIIPPMAVVFVWGEELFAFVYGDEWKEAGKIAGYFAVYYSFRFVYFSQSTIFIALKRLSVEIYMNAIFLLLQVSSVLVGHFLLDSYDWAFLLMAVSGFLFYLVYLMLVLKASKQVTK